ncbi:MAG: hypothetical protein ACRDSZ_04230 [Pseudonocardiaceae bacterium]
MDFGEFDAVTQRQRLGSRLRALRELAGLRTEGSTPTAPTTPTRTAHALIDHIIADPQVEGT